MNLKNIRYISQEFAVIAVLAAIFVLISVNFQDFILIENEKLRIAPFVVGFLPVVFLYIILRQVLSCFSSLIFASIFFYILAEVNRVKQSLTGEPLVWTDISTTSNFSVVKHYMSWEYLLAIPAILGVAALMVKFKQFRTPRFKKIAASSFFLGLLFPISFYPYASKVSEPLSHYIQSGLADFGVRYYSWDWNYNLKATGLPLHLIQTSRREIPARPSNAEIKKFSELESNNVPITDAPKKIIFILCEACWHNDKYFKKEFSPLTQLGFKEFRAISPVYGGGTVNSSFELMTGLPSHGALSGIIYQEYAAMLRADAITYPRALKMHGYETISLHNHYRKFWKRNIVEPKFGFDRFIGLEDMSYDGPIWADDKILFDKTLEEMRKKRGAGFYFLTTVSTHGGYRFDNDFGEREYSERLGKSISRVADFVHEALKIEPDTAILLVGDHKPAMNKFFYESGIFSKEIFTKTGDRNEDFRFALKPPREIVGDVPAFFYHPNAKKSQKFAMQANQVPMYCVPNLFDQAYVNVGLPVFSYARENDICSKFNDGDYYENAKKIPDYIFGLSLL